MCDASSRIHTLAASPRLTSPHSHPPYLPPPPPDSIADGPHLDHEALLKKVVDLKKLQLRLRVEQAGLQGEVGSYEKS